MNPPKAKKIPHKLTSHGIDRIDDYFWMRDRENPDLIDYLNAENDYTNWVLCDYEELKESLFQEMKARIKEKDQSAPYFKNGYWYYSRFEEGAEHAIYCRRKESMDAEEEILLDENEMAKEHSYYEVVSFSVSKDNNLLAFCEDTFGRRLYRLRFKNLETGEFVGSVTEHTSSDLAWHNDNERIYFVTKEEGTLRPSKVFVMNYVDGQAELVFEETDDTFICGVSKSKDFSTIFIGSYSTTTTEHRLKSADEEDEFRVFHEREDDHEYYPEILDGQIFIKSNWKAENFKLYQCDSTDTSKENWETYQEGRDEVMLEDFEPFTDFVVVQEKENGLSRLRIYDRKDDSSKIFPMDEETYTLYIGTNPESTTSKLRIGYSSMTTPSSVLEFDLLTFESTVLKETEVVGDFDKNNYQSERLWAEASDGTKVPVSLVYNKHKYQADGNSPLLLYAYGSYGSTIDPYFSSVRLSLLDRGIAFAIAHIRGGEYLGRSWYEDGKLLKKKNTFTDYIDVAEYLKKEKYVADDKLFGMGGSAGGLLMGAVTNMRPDIWKGIVSQVPFVDVINTMEDETLPLTTGEYSEWGNPADKEFWDYIYSYSPYDQLREQAYPAILVTSGLHDSQVQYWEPTKYVAKLRELKTDENALLLHTNMEAGHGGASGRFEAFKEIALNYAFILSLLDE